MKYIHITFHQIERRPKSFYSFNKTRFEDSLDILQELFYRNRLIISFDDGYKNQLWAGKLLARKNIKAIFFVNSNLIGSQDFLEWYDINFLTEIGHEIGSHSHDHVNLRTLSRDQVRKQIEISCNLIQKKTNIRVSKFAYPWGKHNSLVRQCVKESGLEFGYGTTARPTSRMSNAYALPRFCVNSSSTLSKYSKYLAMPSFTSLENALKEPLRKSI